MSTRPKLHNLWFGVTAIILGANAGPLFAKKKPLKAHVHGSAKLNVASQDKTLSLDLEIPASDIFGFEHAAKSNSEKQTVNDALKTLREKPLELFGVEASLGCKVSKSEVATHTEDHHAEVEASYRLDCAQPFKGQSLKLGLFRAFPRIHSIEVQVLSETGQHGQKVTSATDEIRL